MRSRRVRKSAAISDARSLNGQVMPPFSHPNESAPCRIDFLVSRRFLILARDSIGLYASIEGGTGVR